MLNNDLKNLKVKKNAPAINVAYINNSNDILRDENLKIKNISGIKNKNKKTICDTLITVLMIKQNNIIPKYILKNRFISDLVSFMFNFLNMMTS